VVIRGVLQALYGSNNSAEGADSGSDEDSTGQGSGKKTTTQEPPGTEGSDAELCTDTKVNALFNSADGETFVFKGKRLTPPPWDDGSCCINLNLLRSARPLSNYFKSSRPTPSLL
jgi:hypothetical protein